MYMLRVMQVLFTDLLRSESSGFHCQGCLQRFLADILGKDAVVCYPDGMEQPEGHTMRYPKPPLNRHQHAPTP